MIQSLPQISYRSLRLDRPVSIALEGTRLTLDDGPRRLEAKVIQGERTLELQMPDDGLALADYALDYLFSHLTEASKAVVVSSERRFQISRHEYFQDSEVWTARSSDTAEAWTETKGVRHPLRPRPPAGEHYRRYVPATGTTLSFRTVDPARDLDLFHKWHNQPFVYELWDLNRSKEELAAYLEAGLKDPHQIPMILEVDREPVGYFEVYWATEDRLGPYYENHPYDRGFHFLIGEKRFLGRANTAAAIASVMHFIFLDDPRTRTVVAEPRYDNHKVLKYVQIVPGWRIEKEFDFPHKRAALLMAPREEFFTRGAL